MKRLEALEKIRKGYKLCLDAEAGNYYLFEKVEINKRNEIIKVESSSIISLVSMRFSPFKKLKPTFFTKIFCVY